ncbi:MAG: 16S rRNA (cytidine(1402)-2'-O)-methyltransferase [Rubellimicrobium sp.]|nr:16S rRNA (cytidine(1402)-2'-O)-methyltransferase [Rubellimicrobium sp.]
MAWQKVALDPVLHLVATPIGNARDITLRALDILASADLLAAEDTRSLRRLMDIHGVALAGREIVALHDHSGASAAARLLDALGAGRSVAYASEAGTPVLSDPGFTLVRGAIGRGLAVTAAPGPSALLAALVVAGVPAERFAFMGFLPAAAGERQAVLRELRDFPLPMFFLESPRRIAATLGEMKVIWGSERAAVLCRELTKRFEDVVRGTLGSLADAVAGDGVKGEVVLVVGRGEAAPPDDDAVRAALAQAMGHLRLKDAAGAVAGALGLPRRQVYQVALAMQEEDDE